MRLTPNEVALITSGLTTAMAVVTVWVTRRNTKNTLETQATLAEASLHHQREMAHDERVWQERAAIYVNLIDWIRRHQVHAYTHEGDPSQPVQLKVSQEETRENFRLQARVAAFGSSEVQRLDEELREALMHLHLWNNEQARSQDTKTTDWRKRTVNRPEFHGGSTG